MLSRFIITAIVLVIAFTAMILIPLIKNPVWWYAHRTHPMSAGRSAVHLIYMIVSQSFLSVEYS